MADQETMKDRIAKLLAQAEGTSFEEEAKLAREMAEKLMIKWGIEEAELQHRGQVKPEEIVAHIEDMLGIYHAAWVKVASSIATGLGNLRLLTSARYEGRKKIPTVYIIGHTSDVERWKMMYHSLNIQALTAMNAWWKNAPERAWLGGMEAYKARRQFIIAFGLAVRTRLLDARREETVAGNVSTGAELVLVSKQKAVDAWTQAQYSPRAARGRGIDGSNYGRSEGHAAGMRAGLGGKGVGGGRGQLGG